MHSNTFKNQKIFCFGYGYVARALVRQLKSADPSWKIIGTTQDSEKRHLIRKDGADAIVFSEDRPMFDPLHAFQGMTHMLISIPPNEEGDLVFQAHARDLLQVPTLKWIGYLSSTSVYGNRNGDWVDERSEIRPTSKRGSKRTKAETQWLKLRRIAGIPINIFRLSGIYGPGRSPLDTLAAGETRRIYKEGHVFNRIHVDDIVQVLIASMDQPSPGDIYNLADDLPSASHDIIDYAARLLGVDVPPLVDFDAADMTPMARSFYKDNKRIRNDKIREKLGVQLKYPTYKTGLEALVNDMIQKKDTGS